MPTVSVVVPAYNESHRLGPTLERITGYFRGLGRSYEIVVSDDGSTDGTGRIASAHAKKDPATRIVAAPRNMGKGAAVRRGMLSATGDVILMTDADLSTPVEEYEHLAERIARGYDVAVGSRKVPGARIEARQPTHRAVMGKGFSYLTRWLLSLPVRDCMCGFKCFTHRAAADIFTRAVIDDWSYDPEIVFIAAQLGLQIAEVPVRWSHAAGSRVRAVRDAVTCAAGVVRIRANARKGVYRFDS